MFNIQSEIDNCAASGGGKVIIPAGVYRSGTVHLRSNVILHLSEGAVICGSEVLSDYPAAQDKFSDGSDQERGRALILGESIENAAIEGDGIICGSGGAFPADHPDFQRRPMLLRFVNCQNIRLSGIKLRESAAWTCHLRGCRQVEIDHLDIYSHVNSNNDGIDVDSCSDVEISFCNIDSGDDAVCLKSTLPIPCKNVFIHDCELNSLAAAFKIGTETYGDIRKIVFRNNRIGRGDLGAIKIFSADGAALEDIEISDTEIINASNPLFIRLGERGRIYGDFPAKKAGSIRNIVINGLKGKIQQRTEPIRSEHLPGGSVPGFAHNCLAIMGLPGNPVKDVTFRNIVLTLPGGSEFPGWDEIPERAEGYPEIGYYGILPASGVYMRHVEKADFSGCSITLAKNDLRQKIIMDDVRKISGI